MIKSTLQLLVGLAFVVQMAGCFYVGDDHRWHGGHREYHEHHDSSIDVHLHG